MKLFAKNLTATDCLKRLSIPNKILTFLPAFHGDHAVKLQVRYEDIVWPLACTIRRKGRYKKPVVSKGWRKFVMENGLNVGDRLTFHKEEKQEGDDDDDDDDDDSSTSSLHYRIELKRTTKPSTSIAPDDGEVKRASVLKYCMDQNVIVTGLSNGGGGGGGGDGVVDSNGQVSGCAKEETALEAIALLEQNLNLGLTVDGEVVHQTSRSTSSSFFKTDQRVGFDLDTVLGQSMHGNFLNLELTLAPPILN